MTAAVKSRDNFAAWSVVTVGVADLDAALALWVDSLGFEVFAARDGADAALAGVWALRSNDIARQAIVRTPGSDIGMVHLIEFDDPDPPVRADADVFDLVPKNLDIYAADLPQRVAELREQGHTFRTDSHSEITAPDGTRFREIHMPSHDDVNVVFIEVVGEEKDYTSKGFAGIAPLIFIVPDAEAEKAFFHDALALDKLSDNLLEGPEIERMVGLPPGTALDVSIWGREGIDLGGIEIIEYRGVEGSNLYPRATPKALGILHIAYVVHDASALRRRLSALGTPIVDHGSARTLVAGGRVLSFLSPAGLRIEVYETGRPDAD